MIALDEVEMLRAESEGPPLLLLHGSGACAQVFAPLFPHLGAFDVVALSLPGRGDSRGPAAERAEDAAAWVSRVLDALGGPPPIVLGHSYGGAVALALAQQRAVAGLVLACTGARLRVHPAILALAASNVAHGAPWSARAAFTPSAEPARVAEYEAALADVPPLATLADWRACDAFDVRAELAAIACPALVIGGADDALTPAKHQRFLAENLPRGSLVLEAGGGHMLPWEAPARFAQAVRAWVAGTPDTAA